MCVIYMNGIHEEKTTIEPKAGDLMSTQAGQHP